MHKGIAWLLALAMLLMTFGASAEGVYVMAGYDGDGANHDWTTNQFFARMEDMTGVDFDYQQSIDYANWTQAKAAYLTGAELPDVLLMVDPRLNEYGMLEEAVKTLTKMNARIAELQAAEEKMG